MMINGDQLMNEFWHMSQFKEALNDFTEYNRDITCTMPCNLRRIPNNIHKIAMKLSICVNGLKSNAK